MSPLSLKDAAALESNGTCRDCGEPDCCLMEAHQRILDTAEALEHARLAIARLKAEADEWKASANARLIAAAPDLLEALLRMRDEVREFLPNVCGDALTEAEAAIAKATGGDR